MADSRFANSLVILLELIAATVPPPCLSRNKVNLRRVQSPPDLFVRTFSVLIVQVYSWGHAANGRLGIGAAERIGVPEAERFYFPVPSVLPNLEPISQLSCAHSGLIFQSAPTIQGTRPSHVIASPS